MAKNDAYTFHPEPNTLIIEDQSIRRGYVQLPKQILYASNLSRDAKLLYAVLLGYAWEKGSCFPGYQRLCFDMQASENMVRKYMRELEAVDLLAQKRRGLGKTNIYTLKDLRTAKIEVLEPHFSEAPEPAKSAGKVETEEIEPERPISKDRNASHEKVTFEERQPVVEETRRRPLRRIASETPPQQVRATTEPSENTDGEPPRRASRPTAIGETLKRRRVERPLVSEDRQVITDYIADFAREMNDEAPLRVSVSRAYNLMTRSGVPRQRFIDLMYEARARTKEAQASIRKTVKKDGSSFPVKAKMPFFFATLEQLLGDSLEPANQLNDAEEHS